MAKQKGFVKIRGSIGGLTFYENNGKDLVKTVSSVSRDKIMKDPAFKRTRENMQEFGGAARAGKSLRKGLANILKTMADKVVTSRVTAVMKRINSQSSGPRGERSIEVFTYGNELVGFEFNKDISLDSIFFAPSSMSFNSDRDQVTWTIPDFDTGSFVNPPSGASHFRLVLAAVSLSDFSWSAVTKSYEADNPDENELNDVQYSPYIQIGGPVGNTTVLLADLGYGSALPSNLGVIACVGIIFYQEMNGQHYELAGNNAMHIKSVG